MEKTVIFLSLFLVSFTCYSQTYQGVVMNVQNEPIAYANVVALSNGDLITGTITDEDGKFEITIKSNESFKIVISFIGYEDWKKNFIKNKNTDVGTVILIENKNELEEVVITAKKPTIKRKVDRLIFNIENSIVSSGGDAIDVLQKTPGVRVDGSSIGLIGKSAVRILINDRLSPLSGEDLANYLHTLSSDDIAKIEVITNPPSNMKRKAIVV